MKFLTYLRNRYLYWKMRYVDLDEMLLEDVATHSSYFHNLHKYQLLKRVQEVEEREERYEREQRQARRRR